MFLISKIISNKHLDCNSYFLKRDNWHKVSVYQVTTWMPTQNLPSDVRAVVDAVRFVQSSETIDAEHKMVVLSRYTLLLNIHISAVFYSSLLFHLYICYVTELFLNELEKLT